MQTALTATTFGLADAMFVTEARTSEVDTAKFSTIEDPSKWPTPKMGSQVQRSQRSPVLRQRALINHLNQGGSSTNTNRRRT
jgi:hypothetical protein